MVVHLGLLLALLGVTAPVSLGSGARALYDASGQLTAAQARAAVDQFRPSELLPAFPEGPVPRVYWFRTILDSRDGGPALALRFSYKVTQIDVYGDSPGQHVAGGYDLAAADQAVAPGVLELPPWAVRGDPLYLRVATVIDPRSVSIAPLSRAFVSPLQRRGLFGFFIGFFIAIALFNLFMFASLHDRALVNYAGVMFLNAIKTAISFGSFWMVLPPLTFLGRELIYDTFALGAEVAFGAFSIAFLELAARDRLSMRLVIVGMAAQLSVFITDFFPEATIAFDWTLAVTLFYYGTLLFAGIRSLRGGMAAGRLFAFGIVCAIIGYAVNMSSSLLPRQDLWVYAVQVGTALQALLIAMAVAQRVQETRVRHQQLLLESRHLAQLAMRDGLTGVLNRRAFDESLHDSAARAVADGSRLGILVVDIDRFKQYNDSFGHLAGDEALRMVASTCAACVREGDAFARYGGEEFGAIVPGATQAELLEIGNRMCAALAEIAIELGDGSSLTISVGAASGVPVAGQFGQDLLHAADAALYDAKRSGRNQVSLGEIRAVS